MGPYLASGPLLLLLACDSGSGAVDSRVVALELEVAGVKADLAALGAEVAAATGAVADVAASVATLTETVNGLSPGARTCAAEMVQVGDFCMDRWKASVWDNAECNGTGTAYGIDSADYPSTFPASGDWTAPLYACSIEGVVPAGNLTWSQPSQACALSGTSLCTNAQWQTAVAGTPPGEEDCALTSGEPVATGSHPACVSRWGTYDQVGIRWEWMADWSGAGATWMVPEDGSSGRQNPWPDSYGDGEDYTLNVNGEAMGAGLMMPGLPAAQIRGGDYSTGAEGGSFAMSRARGPSHLAPYIGFRCCAVR